MELTDANLVELNCSTTEGLAVSSRRSSDSSVETVRQPKLQLPVGDVPKSCASCTATISRALDQEKLWKGSKEIAFEHLTSLSVFQRLSSNSCPICQLLWTVLRKADGTLVDQIAKFSNDGINKAGLYLSDGGTDIDEVLNEPKVELATFASLVKSATPDVDSMREEWIDWFSHVGMDEYRLHKIGGTLSLIASGSKLKEGRLRMRLQDDFKMCRFPDDNVFLRATFRVSYRAQTGSRRRVKTTLQEDLAVCWTEKFGHSRGAHSVLGWSPDDLRLDLEAKWTKLASWVNNTAQHLQHGSTCTLPSRVLDLTQEGRVTLMSKLPKSYAALSHRWGASQHLTATIMNLDELQLGISLDRLPATFNDAVIVAKRLGVAALWIDALCIVQDDAKDWLEESKKMGDIYTNAQFVIAVHCAADDSDGFLAQSLTYRKAVKLEVPGTVDGVRIYRRGNFDDIASSGLSKRGWVLQERIMAKHTLHFTKHGIFSETLEDVLSEDGPVQTKFKSDVASSFNGHAALHALRQALTSATVARNDKTPDDWLVLVEIYTNCDLTREEDKLIAISGMANRIALNTHRAWCAGIWSDQIASGLLWLPAQRLYMPTNARAPSWSWAAWEGAVQYPAWYKATAKAKFGSVQPADTPLQDVQWLQGPGILQIQAKIIPLENVIVSSDSAELGPGPDRKGYLTTDDKDLPRLKLNYFVTAHTLRGRRFASRRPVVSEDQLPPCGWIAFDDQSFRQESQQDGAKCTLLGCCFAILIIDRAPSGGLGFHGLFLRPISTLDGQTPVYHRLGAGQLSYSFMLQEHLRHDVWRPEGLSWSTKSNTSRFLLPPDIADLTLVAIR
ncbi:hypothetical protein N0V95_000533 [Ascochyta clinopodiicola]|nr:hypothetical protein N0V95_000533 [Ascochyta clinopodiicola]